LFSSSLQLVFFFIIYFLFSYSFFLSFFLCVLYISFCVCVLFFGVSSLCVWRRRSFIATRVC
jgi:hypothetical protein